MLDGDPEPELLLEPQDGGDVVVAVRVVLDDPPAVEHLDQGLHAQVALRRRAALVVPVFALFGLGHLLPVLHGLVVEVADQGRGLGAGAGEGRRADRVRAVRHLHAATDAGPGIVAVEPVLDRAGAVAELDVGGLPGHQVAGARHDVHRRDAAGTGAPDAVRPHVDRIQVAYFRMERSGSVAARNRADVGVGVDETGHQHLAGDVVLDRAAGRTRVGSADLRDPAALDHQDAFVDRRTGDRQQPRAAKDVGVVLCRGRHGGDECGQCSGEQKRGRVFTHTRSSSRVGPSAGKTDQGRYGTLPPAAGRRFGSPRARGPRSGRRAGSRPGRRRRCGPGCGPSSGR